jgi:hypothetical protein
MTTSKKHSPLTELSKTSSFLLIAKQTAHADSPSSLLPTTTLLGKLSKKWMEPTLWVVISASTKPKSVAHNKTAVAVAVAVAAVATVEIVVVAAVAVIAVVVVAVIAVAVVVTTKEVGKNLLLLDFKKARHFWWAFFCTQMKFTAGSLETVADSSKSGQRVSRRYDASS